MGRLKDLVFATLLQATTENYKPANKRAILDVKKRAQ